MIELSDLILLYPIIPQNYMEKHEDYFYFNIKLFGL